MTAQWIRFRILHELIAYWSESCDPRLARAQAVFKTMNEAPMAAPLGIVFNLGIARFQLDYMSEE